MALPWQTKQKSMQIFEKINIKHQNDFDKHGNEKWIKLKKN